MPFKHTNTLTWWFTAFNDSCICICELALTLNLAFFPVCCETDSLLTSHSPTCACVCVRLSWTERESKNRNYRTSLTRTHTSISISSTISGFSVFLSFSIAHCSSSSSLFLTFNLKFSSSSTSSSSSRWSLLLAKLKIIVENSRRDFRVQCRCAPVDSFVRCFVDALSIYRRRHRRRAWKATAAWYRFPHQIRGVRQRTTERLNWSEWAGAKRKRQRTADCVLCCV